MKKSNIWGESDDKGWGRAAAEKSPEARTVFAPTSAGPGDGTAFFFLFGLKRNRAIDQDMMKREREAISDDIEVLQAAGFTVVVDEEARREDMIAAISGEAEAAPAGVYWSAHGHPDGSVEASNGDKIHPSELNDITVSRRLRLFVMSACYSASRSRTWRAALGGHPLVVGWGRPVTIDRAVDFLTPSEDHHSDLDDLIQRYLVDGGEIPGEMSQVEDKPAWANGTGEPLVPILPAVAKLLGGDHRVIEDAVELRVPTERRRHQVVRISRVLSSQPLMEGMELFAAESEVGELGGVTDPEQLLQKASAPGLARIALVNGPADLPVLLIQAFYPLQGASMEQLAGVVQEVALRADDLERRIFGADCG